MPTRSRVQTATVLSIPVAVAGLVLAAIPAGAAQRPDFQMPFACGEVWQGSTFASHSPSVLSIDWNRDAYDEGHLVVASAPGVVTSVVDLGNTSYGLYVIVDHGGGWTTLHAHLDKSFVVVGQRVDSGEVIALLGNSGGSTGAHLHYEQRLDRADQHGVFDSRSFTYDSWLRSQNCVDTPVVGDWNGNGRSDLGVFRRGKGGGVFRERRRTDVLDKVALGRATDQPVTGDWNGDGTSDPGVWRTTRRRFILGPLGADHQSFHFGAVGDVPVVGDWNGDGVSDVGVFRPATATFRLRQPDGHVSTKVLGTRSSLPVAGDWNGDGISQVGVYDPATSTFTLARAEGGTRSVVYGSPFSLPAVGSWDTKPGTDLGVWDPTTGVFSKRLGPDTVQVRFGHIR